MNRCHAILLAALFPAGLSLADIGPTGAVVTVDQVVEAVLAHSLPVKLAGLDAKAAAAEQTQAERRRWPSLDLEGRATHYEGLRDSSLGPLVTIPAIEDRYGAAVALTQPLYTGGRLGAQVEAATARQQAAEWSGQSAREDVRWQARHTYWAWSKAHFSAVSLRASVARMEAHAADMRNRQAAGLATENERLATDVQLDQTRLRLDEAERAAALARARLGNLAGAELAAGAIPEDAAGALAGRPAGGAAAAFPTNRLELAARREEVRAAEAALQACMASQRPQVALSARYETMRPNLLIVPPEDKWDDDASIGMVMSWNLLDFGLRRAEVAGAAVRLAQARLRLQQEEERIALEVKEASIAAASAGDRLATALRAEASARRNREVADDLWRNGLARHADVLEAEARLVDAQYDIVAARADVMTADAAVQHAQGRQE